MKRTFLAGAAIILTAASSLAATRVHQISDASKITSLTVDRGVNVDYYPVHGENNVTVSGPDNYVGLVQVKQSGSKLTITINSPGSKNIRAPKDLKVTIKLPPVSSITAASSGDIRVRDTYSIGSNNLQVTANSSGDIKFDDLSSTGNVSLTANSSGDVEVKALRATNLMVKVNSSGDVEIDNAHVTNVSLSTSSSGDISLKDGNVSNLKADCASSGDIELKNIKAKNLILNTSSSGDIKASGAATAIKATASSGGVIDLSKLYGDLQQWSASTGGTVKPPHK